MTNSYGAVPPLIFQSTGMKLLAPDGSDTLRLRPVDGPEHEAVGVLCAPHLCEQWADELRSKFHIDTAIIQPSRMARLERSLSTDMSVFQHYDHLVCSIDYVKSDRHRQAFIDHAPDLIIVDEAHTSARPRGNDSGNQQHRRFELLQRLTQRRPDINLILTTATRSNVARS